MILYIAEVKAYQKNENGRQNLRVMIFFKADMSRFKYLQHIMHYTACDIQSLNKMNFSMSLFAHLLFILCIFKCVWLSRTY